MDGDNSSVYDPTANAPMVVVDRRTLVVPVSGRTELVSAKAVAKMHNPSDLVELASFVQGMIGIISSAFVMREPCKVAILPFFALEHSRATLALFMQVLISSQRLQLQASLG